MTASLKQSLYSREILRLATSLPFEDRLKNADASATRRAPLCGSEMHVDVILDDARCLSAIAIRAHACALGQAAAAVVRERAVGLDTKSIRAIREGLEAKLQHGGSDLLWPELEPFAYARHYPARHGAILLPFDTLLAAMDQATA